MLLVKYARMLQAQYNAEESKANSRAQLQNKENGKGGFDMDSFLSPEEQLIQKTLADSYDMRKKKKNGMAEP